MCSLTISSFPLQGEDTVFSIEPPAFILELPKNKREAIEDLVSTMSNSSLFSLGWKKAHLQQLGRELRGIRALHFLGYVFSQPTLCRHMHAIKKSAFKWNGFVRGMSPVLQRDYDNRQLFDELPVFAAWIHVSHERLESVAKEKKWKEFIEILLEEVSS